MADATTTSASSSIKVMVSDVVGGVVFLLSEYSDGNTKKEYLNSKALWAIAEQVIVSLLSRAMDKNSPDFYTKAISTGEVRRNIIQFAVSAIATMLMKRGRVFSHALNSLGSTCLGTDLTKMITTDGDYPLFGGGK